LRNKRVKASVLCITLIFALALPQTFSVLAGDAEESVVFYENFDGNEVSITNLSDASAIIASEDKTAPGNTALELIGGRDRKFDIPASFTADAPTVFEGKFLRKYGAKKTNYWDLRIYLLCGSESTMLTALGADVYAGENWDVWGSLSVPDMTWMDFKLIITRINTAPLTVSAELFVDGVSFGTISQEIKGDNSKFSGIHIEDVNGASGGSIFLDDLLLYEPTGTPVDVIERIKGGETVSQAELEKALALCGEYADSTLMQQNISMILDYANNNGYHYANTITSSTLSDGDVIYADDFNKAEFDFSLNLLPKKSNVIATISDGVNDISTKAAIKGNKLTVTPDEPLSVGVDYTIAISGVYGIDGEVAIMPVSFRTSLVPKVNIKKGGKYIEGTEIIWDTKEGVNVTARLEKSGGTSIDIINSFRLEGAGSYRLYLVAELQSGKRDEETIEFTVLGQHAPVAENVTVTGNADLGSVLTASYKYKDEEKDEKGVCFHRWLHASSANGEYTEISGACGEGDGFLTYTVGQDDIDSYIKFEVTPVSTSFYSNIGTSVRSKAMVAPFRPVASNLRFDSKPEPEKTIKLLFDYRDENCDAEGEPVYRWYYCDSEGENRTQITEATGKEFVLPTESESGKYICASVIPVSSKEPFEGTEVFSRSLAMPERPVVSDVTIKGTGKTGSIVSGYYKYYDKNGDEESAHSKLEWIDSSGNVIGQGAAFTLAAGMAGMEIAFRVTAVSNFEPAESLPVMSDYITISSGSSGGGGSGGGGSRSSYALSGSNSGSIKAEVNEPDKQPDVPKAKCFEDIENHWGKKYIEALYEAGMIKGVDEKTFAPERTITRAEFLTLLLRSQGKAETSYTGVFEDVKAEDWFSGYVQTAYDLEIISKNASFGPNIAINREQMAKLLSFFIKKEETSELTFNDSDQICVNIKEAAAKVVASGVMLGDEQNNFNPKANATRAEAAAVIYRLIYGEEVKNG